MRNPHGSFIWYELLTSDPDAAAAFYGAIVGWTAQRFDNPDVDYRVFMAGDAACGGHMALPQEACEAGARPGWLGYVGVDDVDKSVASITAAGGKVHMAAMDMPGVGRMAMLSDPQGAPFYVMRGAMDEPSTCFAPDVPAHVAWNELSTSDPVAALDFYSKQFGWKKNGSLPMGDLGEYAFINQGDRMIGAVMKRPPNPGAPPPSWLFYFNVAGIEAAARKIGELGGTIVHGPSEIPGGDHIIVATDPQGAVFGLVGKLKT